MKMMNHTNWHQRADTTPFTIRNFVDGHCTDCVGPQTIDKCAPNTGKLLYQFANGDGSEAAQAVA